MPKIDKMLRRLGPLVALGLGFLGPLPGPVHAAPALTLTEVVEHLLQDNPAVQQEQLAVVRSAAQVQQARGAFDWTLNAQAGYRQPRVPQSRNGYLTTETTTSDVYSLSAGASKRLRNGVTVRPGIALFHNADENTSDVLSNAVTTPTLGVTIPLLQGSGTVTNTAVERAAEQRSQASALDSSYSIGKALEAGSASYWRCLAAQRDLELAVRAVGEAHHNQQRLQQLAEQGEISNDALSGAEADLLLREADLGQLRQQLFAARLELARQLGLDSTDPDTLPTVSGEFPSLNEDAARPDEAQLVQLALQQRGDYLAAQRRLQAARIGIDQARDAQRTRLDLKLDLDQVSLEMSRPLGTNASDGQLTERNAAGEQARLTLDTLRQQVATEVRQALYQVQLRRTELQQTRRAQRLLAKLAADTRARVERGETPHGDYQSALDRAVQAGQRANRAWLEYTLAVARLRLATGTLPTDGSTNAATLVKALTSLPVSG